MAKIIWSNKAVASIENIFDYIAKDSPFYARYQIDEILTAVDQLELYPESGRHLPEFTNISQRELIIQPYRLIYRYEVKNDTVYILSVAHGRQLLTANYI